MIINIFWGILFIIIPIMWIINLFIYEPYKANKVYQIYELRDEVSLLAMSGRISECDADYQLLMMLINSEINIRKRNKDSFSVTQYIKCIISPQTSSKYSQSRFNSLVKNEILMIYTQQVLILTASRLDKSLKKLKICLKIASPFVELAELILHHDIGRVKKYKKQTLSEYDQIQKKYGEIISSMII